MKWNLAEIWEVVTEVRAAAPAQIHANVQVSWDEFDERADAIARHLFDAGLGHQDKVAQYLRNCPEYLQGVYGCFKAGYVPVNTNYRYTGAELRYLWENSDTAAVMFHGSFTDTIEPIRSALTGVRSWLWVDDHTGSCPSWATPFEQVASSPTGGRFVPPWGRSGDDQWFLYTGGTTGMPKGVMWTQDTIARLISLIWPTPLGDDSDLADLRAHASSIPPPVMLPAAPFMHASGQMTAMGQLALGGCIVTVPSTRFDAERVLDAIDAHAVTMLVVVGDAMTLPLVEALDRHPGRWPMHALATVLSSGAMWSEPVRSRLLRHQPALTLIDGLGSSEGTGGAFQITSGPAVTATAHFALTDYGVVIDDAGEPVRPGSGTIGKLGIRGLLPVGYYKDPAKTAEVFRTIDGIRYSFPGDHATIDRDGSLVLLGRGSQCINTGGEKVFPEEVEEALKTHPTVRDAGVIGLADARYGEIVCAVVEAEPGREVDVEVLIDHARIDLAGYKLPRKVVVVSSLERGPNGKLDYRHLRDVAMGQPSLPPELT